MNVAIQLMPLTIPPMSSLNQGISPRLLRKEVIIASAPL